jgi:Tfp pilus assembly protein PilF
MTIASPLAMQPPLAQFAELADPEAALGDGEAFARFEAACALQNDGEAARARAAFEALLQAAPAGHAVCAPSWANLGLALDDLGEREPARRAHEQAVALDAQLFAPRLHLGHWWMADARPEAPALAERWLQSAAQLQPQAPTTWSALGGLLSCLRRDADAEACLRHALALDAGHQAARFNLAYLTLRQGRWAEGWACLESRPAPQELARRLPWPRWAGEPLAGRRLLIVNDAGHGDLIHFWRYKPWVEARGAGQIAWMVQSPLIPLLQAQDGVGPVYALDGRIPVSGPDAPELWAPLLSLPWLCGQEPLPGEGAWPDALPYLVCPDAVDVTDVTDVTGALVAAGAGLEAMAPNAQRPLTIGLVWHGNPKHENDAERSLPGVGALAPLRSALAGRDVRFVNLQPEGDAGDVGDAGLDAHSDALHQAGKATLAPLLNGQPLRDFAQVAQTLKSLDLLITVDTAYAHLAGALGCPVWVMLPHWKTDWRWLDDRADSPWYPGVMRLFRQRARGDWAGVMADVAQALTAWCPR